MAKEIIITVHNGVFGKEIDRMCEIIKIKESREMTKKEFAEKFWRNGGAMYHSEANRIVDIFLDTMKEELENGEVLLFRGFGTFEVRQHKKTEGYNPRTGEKVTFKPKKYVKFKTGKDLSEKINGK